MLNAKQELIKEKLEDIYRVVKAEDIESITNQVTGKTVTRQKFLNNLVTYTMGYCYQLIERYQLTTSEDFNVSYVLQALSNEEPETLRDTEFLLEWAISKLALSFGLSPILIKKEMK